MITTEDDWRVLVAAKDAEIQRLTDLVRHQRNELYEDFLLTDEELAALTADSDNGQRVARLESYDAMRTEKDAALRLMLDALEKIRERANREYPVSIGNQGAWARIEREAKAAIAAGREALK